MDRIGKHFPAPQLFWWLAGQSVRRSLLGATKCRKITAANRVFGFSTFQPLFRHLWPATFPFCVRPSFPLAHVLRIRLSRRSLQSICPCPFCPWAAGLWPWQSTKGEATNSQKMDGEWTTGQQCQFSPNAIFSGQKKNKSLPAGCCCTQEVKGVNALDWLLFCWTGPPDVG